MDLDDDPPEFPDALGKLSAPKKLSAFEKDRQAADAKRRRAEAEDAAALKAFTESFDDGDDNEDDDDMVSCMGGGRSPPTGPRGTGAGPPSAPRSGPGSLGASTSGGGGGMGPPPSLKRKRALDEMREAQEARREAAALEDRSERSREDASVPQRREQEEMMVDEAPKPTIQLANLPWQMSPREIKALLHGHLIVHDIAWLDNETNVRSNTFSAIVTLHSETKAAQIENAVTALKAHYLGYGARLSISRHLSSTALHPSMLSHQNGTASSSDLPFGATFEEPQQKTQSSLRNAPPPDQHRGFAPPSSYDSPSHQSNHPTSPIVQVRPPTNLATLRSIHVLVDRLLNQRNPTRALQLENLLMTRPTITSNPAYAFLFDASSEAGIYYRWLLWSEGGTTSRPGELERIFDDAEILFRAPPRGVLPFMDLTSLADVVDASDYNSSEEEGEEDDQGEGRREFNSGRAHDPLSSSSSFTEPAAAGAGAGAGAKGSRSWLSPLPRARLTHLLARLPTTHTRLRKGDIARITHFAISHAGAGAEEVVDLLLLNVRRPFCFTSAAKYEDDSTSDSASAGEEEEEEEEEEEYEPGETLPTIPAPAVQAAVAPSTSTSPAHDPSAAHLTALYVISDLLSASSTAGARNAWKYRQLFEHGFRVTKTLEFLGRLDRELNWGRLKSEQWKRKVGVVFGIWEEKSFFSGEVFGGMRRVFADAGERRGGEERGVKEEVAVVEGFKKLGVGAGAGAVMGVGTIDGAEDEAEKGLAVREVEAVAVADAGEAMELDPDPAPVAAAAIPLMETKSQPAKPRRRMRAEDMFASDEE